jgi:hypothetical protein
MALVAGCSSGDGPDLPLSVLSGETPAGVEWELVLFEARDGDSTCVGFSAPGPELNPGGACGPTSDGSPVLVYEGISVPPATNWSIAAFTEANAATLSVAVEGRNAQTAEFVATKDMPDGWRAAAVVVDDECASIHNVVVTDSDGNELYRRDLTDAGSVCDPPPLLDG